MMNLACFALVALLAILFDGFEKDGIRLPSWVMMHITGHIMRPAAATLWMIATDSLSCDTHMLCDDFLFRTCKVHF